MISQWILPSFLRILPSSKPCLSFMTNSKADISEGGGGQRGGWVNQLEKDHFWMAKWGPIKYYMYLYVQMDIWYTWCFICLDCTHIIWTVKRALPVSLGSTLFFFFQPQPSGIVNECFSQDSRFQKSLKEGPRAIPRAWWLMVSFVGSAWVIQFGSFNSSTSTRTMFWSVSMEMTLATECLLFFQLPTVMDP